MNKLENIFNTMQQQQISKLLLTLFLILYLLVVSDIYSFANGSAPLVNLFELDRNRLVPGANFHVVIDKANFNIQNDVITQVAMRFKMQNNSFSTLSLKRFYLNLDDGQIILNAEMPELDRLAGIKDQSFWRGWLLPYQGELVIEHKKNDISDEKVLLIEIPDTDWAPVWAILIVTILIGIFSFISPNPFKPSHFFKDDECESKWNAKNKYLKVLRAPLNFTITPNGFYSISLMQILFWSVITLFGLVYVFRLSGEFLTISPQVLILLGIGSGTAITSKLNAMKKSRELPAKYLKLIKRKRIPKLSDLISIEGQANVFKFQMLTFTMLVGGIVVVNILKNNAFPTIPDNLLYIMGISSITYLGNEITHKNIWERIDEKRKIIEEIAKKRKKPLNTSKQIEALKIPEVEELKELLNSVYQ